MIKIRILILLLFGFLFYACKSPMEAVTETKPLYPASVNKEVSLQEKQIIDNLIIRRLDIINQQKNAELASDEGGQPTVSLDDINKKLNAIDLEIAGYVNNMARETYYREAWRKAASGF